MPYPTKGEGTQHYVSRFMGSSEANKSFPDQKQRAAVAYSIARQRGLAKSVRHGKRRTSEPEDDPVKFPKSARRAPKESANAVAGSGGGAGGV